MLHISMELLSTFVTIVLIIFLEMPIDFKFASVLGVIAPLLPKITGKTRPPPTLNFLFKYCKYGRYVVRKEA
jgi:hypothetical protein